MALGGVVGAVGFVFRIVDEDAVCVRLVDKLEGGLVERGARKVVTAVRDAPAVTHFGWAFGPVNEWSPGHLTFLGQQVRRF